MMKFVLAALAVLALSNPMDAYTLPRTGSGALADELQGFADVIPVDQMITILLQYLAEDAEVQQMFSYLRSEEFQKLILDIEAIPEVRDLLKYVQDAGLDIYYLVNAGHKILDLPPFKPMVYENHKITGGIRGFLDDIEAIFPVQKVKELYEYKMAHSKLFAEFMARMRSPEVQKVADAIVANPNLRSVIDKAVKAGLKVNDVKEFLERFLGIKINI